MIQRSGYKTEAYYSIADDGYVTQILHLINPMVDQKELRSPPVVLQDAVHIEPSCYLFASSIQHKPQKYPRTFGQDGPIASSNRSLAFTLANNGFDVWLVSTRGVNNANRAFVKDPERYRYLGANFKPDKSMLQYSKSSEYWYFGLDELIAYEMKNQLDLVLNLTKAIDFFYVSYSLSTPTTLIFLAEHREYARRVRQYVQLSPAIAASHPTVFSRVVFEEMMPLFPTRGIGLLPLYSGESIIKHLFLQTSRSMELRYTLLYELLAQLFGPSPKYQTNLERNMLAHIFLPNSFKEIQHYALNSKARKLTKFDYGPAKNFQVYGQYDPPIYNASYIEVQNWMVFSGTEDVLASPETVQRFLNNTSSPKPVNHKIIPLFAHLDMVAGVENDKYVNLPILQSFIDSSD